VRAWLASGIVGVLLACAAPARAQDRPLADAITVARGECLTEGPLLEHLRAWLERDRVDARLSVVIEEGDGGGASFVVLSEGVGRAARRFETLPRDCADRRAAVALAVALAIDAAVLDDLVPPRARAPAEASPTEADGGLTVGVEVVAEALVLIEVLPEVAAAWQIGARVVFDHTFVIGFSGWLSSVSGAALQPGRVDTQLSGGRVDACLRRDDVVIVRGCLGVAAGAGRGRGLDVPEAAEAHVPYVALVGRLGVGFPITDFLTLEVSADAWLALLRPRFDLIAGERVVTSATLPLGGGMGALGLSVELL